MILSPNYAKSLIRKGQATPTTTVEHETGRTLQAIDRHDVQRVDHYFLPASEDTRRQHVQRG